MGALTCHVCGCDVAAAGCSPGDGHLYCPDHVPHEVDLATARTCAACARGEHVDHALGVWWHATEELRERHGGQVCPCERCGGLARQRAHVDRMRELSRARARELAARPSPFTPWIKPAAATSTDAGASDVDEHQADGHPQCAGQLAFAVDDAQPALF